MISLDETLAPGEILKLAKEKTVKECGECFFVFIEKDEEENCPFCNSDYLLKVGVK